jgi:hypothetical protein
MTGPVDDKRGGERFPILGELHGEVTVFQPIVIREISRGGAQIETSVPLQLNSLHQFRLMLGTTYRSGIEFIEMSEPVSVAIVEFLNAIRNARRIS